MAADARLFDARDRWHALVIVKDDQPPEGSGAITAGQSLLLSVTPKRDMPTDAWVLELASELLARSWRCSSRPSPSPTALQWDLLGFNRYLSSLAYPPCGFWQDGARHPVAPPVGTGFMNETDLLEAVEEAHKASVRAHGPSLLEASADLALVGLLRRLRNHWCPRHRTIDLADFLAVTRAYAGAKVADALSADLHARGFPDPATVFPGTGCVVHTHGAVESIKCTNGDVLESATPGADGSPKAP